MTVWPFKSNTPFTVRLPVTPNGFGTTVVPAITTLVTMSAGRLTPPWMTVVATFQRPPTASISEGPANVAATGPVTVPLLNVAVPLISTLLAKAAPEIACTNWGGSERIKISRATRVVNDTVLKELLTDVLQRESVKDRGELELRFSRPWNAVAVPDDPLSIKLTELPSSGVSPNFICRFDLLAGEEKVGTFQQPLTAKVWKEIFVARSNLTRGTALRAVAAVGGS